MIETFGTMADGDPVYRVSLEKNGMTAGILTYGASLQSLRLRQNSPSLVLGFRDFSSYLKYPYFGPFVGRVANRIAEGKFSLAGKFFNLDMNENNRQTLHGGANGISSKNWQIVDHDVSSLTLKVVDWEAETGFPGDCEILATYSLSQNYCLTMEIVATCSKPTICNIAHHSYFNLNGTGSILDHQMWISADHYLPVDENQIPTGKIEPVKNTDFDFRKPRELSVGSCTDIDHNFCLKTAANNCRPVARLRSQKSEIEMEISTDQCGLQVYTGKHLDTSRSGVNGQMFKAYSGIALEPQGWPDAPNQPNFPSVSLLAGKVYRQKTQFKFSNLST